MPSWLTTMVAAVPLLTIIAFWMNLSSRITKAEVIGEKAKEEAALATEKYALLSASFALYRESIATNYVNREIMREVEGRLTEAIGALSTRIDRVLERPTRGS